MCVCEVHLAVVELYHTCLEYLVALRLILIRHQKMETVKIKDWISLQSRGKDPAWWISKHFVNALWSHVPVGQGSWP